MSAHLDTHIAVWLYAGETDRISKRAALVINAEPLVASSIVVLELQYLHEIGRLTVAPRAIVAELNRSGNREPIARGGRRTGDGSRLDT